MDAAPTEAVTEAADAEPVPTEPAPSTERPGWRLLLVVFLLASGVFAFSHYEHTRRPGTHPYLVEDLDRRVVGNPNPDGYYSGFDHAQYLFEARRLADGELPSKARYVFGLGYPAVAVPFLELGFEKDPFFPVDLLAFAGVIAMTAVLGARLRSVQFGLGAAAAVALATPLISDTRLPWSSTVTLVAIVASLVLITGPRELDWRHGLLLGVLIGWTFSARYADAVFVGLLALVGLWFRGRRPDAIIGMLAGALVLIGLTLWSHAEVLGDAFTTPYESHKVQGTSDASLESFDLGKIPRTFVELFITAQDGGRRVFADPIMFGFLWLPLVPFGAAALVRDRPRWWRTFAAGAVVSVLAVALYCSFKIGGRDLAGGASHYFKAWFPLWGLLGAYGAVRGYELVRNRGWITVA